MYFDTEFKTTAVSGTLPVVVGATARNCKIHTIVCPKATSGTVTVSDGTTAYFTLPVGSIGTFILDAVFANGVTVTNSAADTVLINAIVY